MTKFLTFYNLCPIENPKDFQGIADDEQEGNIITTLTRNMVVVMTISSQHQIRSWSVLEKLSSKVVYDRRSQQYVGVFANRALRCWDENTKDVNKCKKLKFQKSIAQLISTDEDTLVLYYDGNCELLAAAIQSRKEQVDTSAAASAQHELLASTHTFSNGLVSSLADGRQLLTYFDRENDSGDLSLVRLPLRSSADGGGGDNSYALRFRLKRDIMDVRVAGYAVIEGDDSPMLLTIWSDKRIFLQSLHDSANPEKSPGNFVSTLAALHTDSPLSVRGISRHLVAIYGANCGLDGSTLLLYNTQFKVIKAKQYFKVYFDESRLWATVGENILLAMGQNLSVVSYRASKELLAELVGTQANNEFQTTVEGEHINEEDPLQECLQYASESAQEAAPVKAKANAKAQAIIAADGKLVAFESLRDFDASLSALTKLQMQVELVEDVERPLEDIQIQLMSNYAETGFRTRELQFIARQLERCGASEHEISEKLLTVLIKAQLLEDIAVCLRRYTNISEKMLAKTLKFVLGQFEASSVSAAAEKADTKSVEQHRTKLNGNSAQQMQVDANVELETDAEFPNFDILAPASASSATGNSPAEVLNLLLACSFDPTTIAIHIRREIEYPHVLLLLEHLLDMLTASAASGGGVVVESRASFLPSCVDQEMQLLRWFGVFLNSHFQNLALSKDLRLVELLFKWHELFAHYKREVLELEQVAALLYNIVQRKQMLKGTNYSKWYNIEEVVLY